MTDTTMNEYEHLLADQVHEAVQRSETGRERSLQSADFRVGVSDLGFCSERTRRMLAKMEPDEEDWTKAFIGTALGAFLEQAVVTTIWPDAIIQPEVMLTLHGDQHTYRLLGHPDVIRPSGTVIDFKTAGGLEAVRRTGPSQQQQFQRHGYAKAAHTAGLFDPHVDLADVVVANIWYDRTGQEPMPHVQAELYSEEVVEQATWWVDETVYNFTQNVESRKEPPREMCEKVCGFYATCRALDTDVEGLLSDDTVLASVDMYREGSELEKQGKQLKDEAKRHLDGITGSTGEYTVRWVHVNGSHVEFDRDPYERLDVRRIK